MDKDRTSPELRHDREVLIQATLVKIRAEHKVIHEMLTDAGIPEYVAGDGVRTCLLGRVAIALDRLK